MPQQLEVREEAFEKAERWIRSVRDHGGIPAPVIKTFQNNKRPPAYRDARIDIEVLAGIAFHRGILDS